MPRILELCAAATGNAFLTPQEFTEKAAVTGFAKTLDAAAMNASARDQIPNKEKAEKLKTPGAAPSKDIKAADEKNEAIDPEAEEKTEHEDGDVLAIQAMIELVQLTAKAEGAADTAGPEAAGAADAAKPEIAPVSGIARADAAAEISGAAMHEASLADENPTPVPTEPSQTPEAEMNIPAAEDSGSLKDFISEVNAALEKAKDAAQSSEDAAPTAVREEKPSFEKKTEITRPEDEVGEAAAGEEDTLGKIAPEAKSDAEAQTDTKSGAEMGAADEAGERRRVSTDPAENHFTINHFRSNTANEVAAPQQNEQLAKALETAMTRFTDDLRSVNASGNTVTIALDPEELGSVSITLVTENNALTAKIITDNKEAATMLSEQIQQFVDSMAEKGVTVEKTEVVYSQTGQSGQGLGEGRREADARNGRENNYFFFANDERADTEVSFVGLRDVYEAAARYYEEAAPVDYKV